ncbi:MAG TPA: hypothetical protein VGX93_02250, partial [Chthoniobacterales bacterium]|nr:hypothetical protein [Chthoniobacterales bacterium]
MRALVSAALVRINDHRSGSAALPIFRPLFSRELCSVLCGRLLWGARLRLALDDKAGIFRAMASPRVATDLAGYFHAASLAELEENQMMIVHGADRPVLLCRHEGQVFA